MAEAGGAVRSLVTFLSVAPAKTLYIVDHDGRLARRIASALASRALQVETRSDGEELMASLDADRAGCVFVEKHAPGLSAVEIASRLRLRGITIPVIVIEAGGLVGRRSGPSEAATRAFRRGSPKGSGARRAAPGGRMGTSGVSVSGQQAGPDALPTIEVLRERFERLTSREREVAQLVAQGYSSKELARALSLRKSTVDNHRARILEKLRLANSVQLTRFLSLLLAEH